MSTPVKQTGFTVKRENFPAGHLFTFTFGHSFTKEQFLEFLALVNKLLASKQKFAMIMDSTLCTDVPKTAVLMLTNWMKNNELLIAETLLGTSIVITSTLVTNLVNIAFKIKKPIRPFKLAKTYGESYEFAKSLVK